MPGAIDTPAAHEDTTEADESVLVDAAIAGNASAFAALYKCYVPRVYRYCYYRTGNRADAEDLTQQVFLQAWRAVQRYRPGKAPFVAWLLAISHNQAVSYHRKAREVTSEAFEVVSEVDADPEACAMNSLAYDAVRRAVLKLKPERQKVIALKFVESFSIAEIAGVMGKSENNVRTMLQRALGDLRRLLEIEDLQADRSAGRHASHAMSSMARRLVSQLRRPETPSS